jgi:cell division protease FtsH
MERPKERFTSVGGCPEVIDELKELKKDLESVIKGNQKIYLPRGIVLSGGPGTGKTLLARSLAGEVDCPFLQIDSSQSTTAILVGTGQMRVKSAFDAARMARDLHTKMLRSLPGAAGNEEGVCIMFFDEFDSIGSKRQSIDLGSNADSERKNVVNALLNEMDGIDKTRNRNIIVMAATNFRDDLDPALMRPGRFTKKVDIPLPTTPEQRLDILEKLSVHLIEHKGKKLESKDALGMIAKITPGKSGDHLRSILEEAVAIARRDGERDVISEMDLFEAYQRESFGRPKPNLIKADKHELVIRHENGHALCALAGGIGVFLMSSVPRGDSAGRVVIDPEGIPEMLATKRDMLAAILLTAGGRAAELEGYGSLGITRGADSDLEQIRNMVTSMISSGLFDGMYSRRIFNHPQSKWDDKQTRVVDTIADRAVAAAREVLQTVGEDKMKVLVDDARKIDKELVGLEAQQFYLDRLGNDTLKAMQDVAHKFFLDPLGLGNTAAAPAAPETTEGDAQATA